MLADKGPGLPAGEQLLEDVADAVEKQLPVPRRAGGLCGENRHAEGGGEVRGDPQGRRLGPVLRPGAENGVVEGLLEPDVVVFLLPFVAFPDLPHPPPVGPVQASGPENAYQDGQDCKGRQKQQRPGDDLHDLLLNGGVGDDAGVPPAADRGLHPGDQAPAGFRGVKAVAAASQKGSQAPGIVQDGAEGVVFAAQDHLALGVQNEEVHGLVVDRHGHAADVLRRHVDDDGAFQAVPAGVAVYEGVIVLGGDRGQAVPGRPGDGGEVPADAAFQPLHHVLVVEVRGGVGGHSDVNLVGGGVIIVDGAVEIVVFLLKTA